jgi:hypothetical protein
MKYLFILLLPFNLLAQEINPAAPELPRQLEKEKQIAENNGRNWISQEVGRGTIYSLKLYCDDHHDDCIELVIPQEEIDEYESARDAKIESARVKSEEIKALRDKVGSLTLPEIKEMLKYLLRNVE